ncbi:MAG: nucleoside hydrolase [Clostridiales Family XIII bacterium]|jgi:inosine-uridine nucleoside N-ribohydrolase|nr:nucleoside hydrolase [Clostridiales Family XIII bacterium]
MKTKILIDTDLGDDADDAAALIMSLHSPELEILGITTVLHNTRKRAAMVLDLLRRYGRNDIPVHCGYGRPLIERLPYEESPVQYAILPDDRGVPEGDENDAVGFIIRTAAEYQDVTIVEMGPMTNLGMAFYRAPDIMKSVRVVAMGGDFAGGGTEWNMQCDPEAARLVMDGAGRLEMFGLDVTKHLLVTPEFLEQLCPPDNECMAYWRSGAKIYCETTGWKLMLHDALPIAYLIDPSVARLRRGDYTIELSGALTRGSIVSKTDIYEIEPESERDFFYAYAEGLNKEQFYELVKERLY